MEIEERIHHERKSSTAERAKESRLGVINKYYKSKKGIVERKRERERETGR